MKIVMTLMVRDEADIVEAMLEHHLAQGIDKFIVTDNGSRDGTVEILERFVGRGVIDLRHDPVHRKQQSRLVSMMARDAYTMYGADWVINADADEFWVAEDPSLTVRAALENHPKSLQSFIVPVIDMTGAPARRGTGLTRLRFRDNRTDDELNKVGLLGHSTPDAIHIGVDDIVIAQGNHQASLPSFGAPPGEFALEVLHLPWRSWRQFAQKVKNAGLAYDANPELRPSPNHHGMRDYARLKDGILLDFYIARHPSDTEINAGVADGTYTIESRLKDSVLPAIPDILFTEAEIAEARTRIAPVLHSEARALTAERELRSIRGQRAHDAELAVERLRAIEHDRDKLQARVDEFENRKLTKVINHASRLLRLRP